MITTFKVLLVFVVLLLPLSGNSRRKRGINTAQKINYTHIRSRYAINKNGELEESEENK